MCKEAGGGGEGARDTESKTRTPHKVVGKNTHSVRPFRDKHVIPEVSEFSNPVELYMYFS